MSRTKMWMNWVDKGNVIPPPLNIFAGIKIIIKSLRHCGKRMKKCCPCWKDEVSEISAYLITMNTIVVLKISYGK